MTTITRYDETRADKYSADDLKDMLAKGHAMKNANGDPSYPIADEDDLDKAIKAVGRGNADHDAIRKHIIDRAKALGLDSKIPDNWNADGSLKDADEAKSAPPTAAERREASMSFGDLQSKVYEALIGTLHPDDEWDIWIEDFGPDWVVYQDYDGADPGLYQLAYLVDAAGCVQFAGDPVRVDRKTSFVPVQMNSADPAGQQAKPEAKSRIPSRRRPLQHSRRSLERAPEWRRVTSRFEVRASQDGSDIVLTGTPIVYDTPYSVRDMLGTFRETMKPGVATEVMNRGDLDVRFLFNHEGLPLARTTSGTLTLTDTPTGLRAEAHLDGRQQLANDLAVAVERGDVSQMSCGFVVADDEWRWGDDSIEERDIFSFDDLFDVSGVTYPASPTTDLELAQRMLARAGSESRERIRRLFEVGSAIRSGRGLVQKDGDALRAAAEALYNVERVGVPLTVRLDAYTHATDVLFGTLRAGKMLSADNQADIEAALDALHSCDDIDIPSITKALETIDKALDDGQEALSSVIGRANPDGDPADKNPTLVDATDPAGDKDARSRQRQKLRLLDVA